MSVFRLSIRAQLSLFVAAFVLMLVGVASISAVRFQTVDQITTELDRKWLASQNLLGETAVRITRLRITESVGTFAPASSVDAINNLLIEHRHEIETEIRDYNALFASMPHDNATVAKLNTFNEKVATLLTAHDKWASEPQARLPNFLQSFRHYTGAMAALEDMAEVTNFSVRAASERVNGLTRQGVIAMLIISAFGTCMGAWLIMRIGSDITGPLSDITQSLTRLAAGDRNVTVPARHRNDEIGEMAEAFEVFRANASALEAAHEATREAQAQAEVLARHDALTGLPNRRVFGAEMDDAIARVQRGMTIASTLLIDLDRFKPVNDLQGHQVGDAVLCEVANRLNEVVRKSDTVARLGGDEFAIVMESEPGSYPESATRMARRVLTTIRRPITVGDSIIEIDASIGIASCPADGSDSDTLLRSADIAMYRAKNAGRGQFCFFEASMDAELRAQAALEKDLRAAVADCVIEPHYQPLIDLRTNEIYGVELLARWEHPTRGWIPPDVFIPLAEQINLIRDITFSVLRKACRHAADWDSTLQLSLNVSPLQLRDTSLPECILEILAEEKFDPKRLDIEVTESALLSDLPTAKAVLTALQAHGVKVSLDDFGTGYSSLSHLRELCFDKVKIDRSFVQTMQDNNESEKIVDVVLNLAKSLGIDTVAEGVETSDISDRLAAKGCEIGQGYFYGRPVNAETLKAKLMSMRTVASKSA